LSLSIGSREFRSLAAIARADPASASALTAHGDNAAILSATSSTSKCVLDALNDSSEPVRLGVVCFFAHSSTGATALTRLPPPFPPSLHAFPGSYPSFVFITDVIGCKSSTLSLTALIVVVVVVVVVERPLESIFAPIPTRALSELNAISLQRMNTRFAVVHTRERVVSLNRTSSRPVRPSFLERRLLSSVVASRGHIHGHSNDVTARVSRVVTFYIHRWAFDHF
jgi:hypothetical protein